MRRQAVETLLLLQHAAALRPWERCCSLAHWAPAMRCCSSSSCRNTRSSSWCKKYGSKHRGCNSSSKSCSAARGVQLFKGGNFEDYIISSNMFITGSCRAAFIHCSSKSTSSRGSSSRSSSSRRASSSRRISGRRLCSRIDGIGRSWIMDYSKRGSLFQMTRSNAISSSSSEVDSSRGITSRNAGGSGVCSSSVWNCGDRRSSSSLAALPAGSSAQLLLNCLQWEWCMWAFGRRSNAAKSPGCCCCCASFPKQFVHGTENPAAATATAAPAAAPTAAASTAAAGLTAAAAPAATAGTTAEGAKRKSPVAFALRERAKGGRGLLAAAAACGRTAVVGGEAVAKRPTTGAAASATARAKAAAAAQFLARIPVRAAAIAAARWSWRLELSGTTPAAERSLKSISATNNACASSHAAAWMCNSTGVIMPAGAAATAGDGDAVGGTRPLEHRRAILATAAGTSGSAALSKSGSVSAALPGSGSVSSAAMSLAHATVAPAAVDSAWNAIVHHRPSTSVKRTLCSQRVFFPPASTTPLDAGSMPHAVAAAASMPRPFAAAVTVSVARRGAAAADSIPERDAFSGSAMPRVFGADGAAAAAKVQHRAAAAATNGLAGGFAVAAKKKGQLLARLVRLHAPVGWLLLFWPCAQSALLAMPVAAESVLFPAAARTFIAEQQHGTTLQQLRRWWSQQQQRQQVKEEDAEVASAAAAAGTTAKATPEGEDTTRERGFPRAAAAAAGGADAAATPTKETENTPLEGVWGDTHSSLWMPCSLEDLLLLTTAKWIILCGIGAFMMRSAGCIINDIWDRRLDARVQRTQTRPLASGELSVGAAVAALLLLLSLSLLLLLLFPPAAVLVALASPLLVFIYPAMKRITHWPQLVLGLTFNWGALVGWTAVQGNLQLPYTLDLCNGEEAAAAAGEEKSAVETVEGGQGEQKEGRRHSAKSIDAERTSSVAAAAASTTGAQAGGGGEEEAASIIAVKTAAASCAASVLRWFEQLKQQADSQQQSREAQQQQQQMCRENQQDWWRLAPWGLYIAGGFWTLTYDTIYAHQDKRDDAAVGIKSTALLFGRKTRAWTGTFATIYAAVLLCVGCCMQFHGPYFYCGVACSYAQLLRQIICTNLDSPTACARAFRANNWVGATLFASIALEKAAEKCRSTYSTILPSSAAPAAAGGGAPAAASGAVATSVSAVSPESAASPKYPTAITHTPQSAVS